MPKDTMKRRAEIISELMREAKGSFVTVYRVMCEVRTANHDYSLVARLKKSDVIAAIRRLQSK